MRTTTESIRCDGCEKELIQDTGYPAVYALQLSAIDVNRSTSSFQYSVICHPPIKKSHHFCNFICLHEWAGKTHEVNKFSEAIHKPEFTGYLLSHEREIAERMNDFGELRKIFYAVFGRVAEAAPPGEAL